MTPELLAHLSPKQSEAWGRCETVRHGMDCDADIRQMTRHDLPEALLELAQTNRDFRECVKSHQKANAELEVIWAAVDAAPCWSNCSSRKRGTPIPFERFKNPICKGAWVLGTACGRCEKCEFTRLPMALEPDPCDCWKSRLPK